MNKADNLLKLKSILSAHPQRPLRLCGFIGSLSGAMSFPHHKLTFPLTNNPQMR